MPDYEQCPFCERVFEVPSGGPLIDLDTSRRSSHLEGHIRNDHNKVRLRKGSNYKWVDAGEMKRLAESWDEMRQATAAGTKVTKSRGR